MTPLPKLLAEEFLSDYVEDVPRFVRVGALCALDCMRAYPERFPRADWIKVHAKYAAIAAIRDAWLAP